MSANSSSLATRVMRGAVAMLLLRWVTRVLGLVSVAITARLLTPDDFGVMGTASIVLRLFLNLSSSGGGEVLVRMKNLEPDHVHTVWTMRLLMSIPLALTLFLLSGPLSVWLHEPRVADVIKLVAFIPCFEALASPGPTLLAREMNFTRLFYLRVAVKFISVIATIVLAFVLRDYWALVLGQVSAALALIVVTHAFWPYLPRLTICRVHETGSYTFWSFWRNVAIYLADTIDEFMVRRTSGTELFAHYHASRDLSRVFFTELVAQAAMPLFSAYSKLQDQPQRLRSAVTVSLGASTILLSFISLIIYASADSLVRLILGPQWHAAGPYLQFLALGVGAQTLARMARNVYSATDRQKLSFVVWCLRAAITGLSVAAGFAYGDALLVVRLVAVSGIVMTLLELWLVYRILGGRYPVVALYRSSAVAGLTMLLALSLLPASLAAWPFLDLMAKGALGASVYGLALLLLWHATGRPQGPEHALLQRLPARARKLLGA